MKPLPPFGSLTADVHEEERDVLDYQGELDDAVGLLTAEQNVLLGGSVTAGRKERPSVSQKHFHSLYDPVKGLNLKGV